MLARKELIIMINEQSVMLTTYNNPYDPFVDYDSWYRFDVNNGTDCCGYLSRMVDSIVAEDSKLDNTKDSFVDDETMNEITKEAMKKIIKQDSFTYLIVHPGDKRYKLPIDEFNRTIPMVKSIVE